MDPLHLVESACKSVRSVKRGVGAYLGEVRRVWVGALDDVAEQARQRLLAREEAEEVLEPEIFAGAAASLADESRGDLAGLCGTSVREDKQQDGVSQGPHPADPQPQPRCTRCDTKLGEIAATSNDVPGMFCSDRCRKAAEILQVLRSSPSGAPTAGDDPVGVSDGIPPLSPPTGIPDPGQFAAVAVREVLATSMSTGRGHLRIQDARTADWDEDDWYDWRECVAAEVSRRINAAAADRRVADRLDAVPSRFRRWFE